MKKLQFKNDGFSPLANDILEKTRQTNPFLPNMYVGMANNTALLDGYLYAYESFKANAGFTAQETQIISLAVSYENNCEYCVAAHSFVGEMMAKIPSEIIEAIRKGEPVGDSKINALVTLTRSLTANKGKASPQEINDFLEAGYSESHILGIIAGIGAKTMANYANNITVPELDGPFTGKAWKK